MQVSAPTCTHLPAPMAVPVVPDRKLAIVDGNIVSGLVHSQHFIETPVNIVYVMGDEDPTFKCAQDLDYEFRHLISWFEFFTNPDQMRLIAHAYKLQQPYTRTHAKNGTNLRILRPDFSVAGRYACEGINRDMDLEYFAAELIVLGRNAVAAAFVMLHRRVHMDNIIVGYSVLVAGFTVFMLIHIVSV